MTILGDAQIAGDHAFDAAVFQDQLMRRIEEAGRYLPVENLALSPQCGFASAMEGNLLSEDDQWRKLQLVVDTARRVWKDA